MLDHLAAYKVVLGSQSPRRRELLKGLDIPFEVKPMPDVDESYPDTLQGADIPLYIARKKAEAFHNLMHDDTLLITADTIVWLEGKVYGKPKDEADAKAMLHALSGKTHQVHTGVVIKTKQKETSFAVTTSVKFAPLTNEEIEAYVTKYKPLDKAGSYGVQEWIGYVAVEGMEGSYFNVMGLPVHRLYQELKRF